MAIRTLHLLSLLALGFLILFLQWPWWLGIGIIFVALVLAVGEEEQAPKQLPMPAISKPVISKPVLTAPVTAPAPAAKAAFKQGYVTDPIFFRPSIPPDGIAGLKAISPEPEYKTPGDPGNVTIGGRTGAMSMYLDAPEEFGGTKECARIRIKGDLRINMPFMQQDDPIAGTKPLTNLITAHFRTGTNIIDTKVLEPTFETIKTAADEWADQWAKEWK